MQNGSLVAASDRLDAERPVDRTLFSHGTVAILPDYGLVFAQRTCHLEAFQRGVGRLHRRAAHCGSNRPLGLAMILLDCIAEVCRLPVHRLARTLAPVVGPAMVMPGMGILPVLIVGGSSQSLDPSRALPGSKSRIKGPVPDNRSQSQQAANFAAGPDRATQTGRAMLPFLPASSVRGNCFDCPAT